MYFDLGCIIRCFAGEQREIFMKEDGNFQLGEIIFFSELVILWKKWPTISQKNILNFGDMIWKRKQTDIWIN